MQIILMGNDEALHSDLSGKTFFINCISERATLILFTKIYHSNEILRLVMQDGMILNWFGNSVEVLAIQQAMWTKCAFHE